MYTLYISSRVNQICIGVKWILLFELYLAGCFKNQIRD
jgi:hypothetical protein